MIRFLHPILSQPISLNGGCYNILVVENPNFLVEMVENIQNFLGKMDSDISIVENGEKYKALDKITLISDIFNIDFNSKALQSALTKRIVKALGDYDYQLGELYGESVQILFKAMIDINVSVDIADNMDKASFVKLFSPTIECGYDRLLERLVNYIDVLVEFLDTKCVIFVNLFEFLSREDCMQLYSHCHDKEVVVFVLQSRRKYDFDNQQLIVIDNDLCEVVANLMDL